jgi:pescadillo protein
MRRMKKAMGKRDEDQQKRLEESKPQYTVDHLVKERYPAFVDAVRDMDDVLCMVFLFRCAGLPQGRA